MPADPSWGSPSPAAVEHCGRLLKAAKTSSTTAETSIVNDTERYEFHFELSRPKSMTCPVTLHNSWSSENYLLEDSEDSTDRQRDANFQSRWLNVKLTVLSGAYSYTSRVRLTSPI